jgi:hypothetical protein
MTTAIQRANGIDTMAYSELTSASTSAPSVMPAPSATNDLGGDPTTMIYALISKQRNNSMAAGEKRIEHNHQLEHAEQLKEDAAFKKQQDDKANAEVWGIFGKIASCVAIAVSAVAAVCSCGAASALCVGACCLSALAFADGETQCLSKLTGDPNASKWFDMGCGIGAALCTGGAGIAASGVSVGAKVLEVAGSACKIAQQVIANSTTDQGWQYAAMGLGAAGAIGDVSMCFGGAAKATSSIFGAATKTVKAAAGVTEAVAAGAEGVGTIVTSEYQASAIDHEADAKTASMEIAHLQQLTSWLVDGIKDTDKSHERALRTLSGAIQTQAQTLVIASARV